MFPGRVKMQFARGSHQGMPVQDDDAFSALARQAFQASEQFNFLARIQLLVEPTHGAKGFRFTKDERTRSPLLQPAQQIPAAGDERSHRIMSVQTNRAASSQTLARPERRR